MKVLSLQHLVIGITKNIFAIAFLFAGSLSFGQTTENYDGAGTSNNQVLANGFAAFNYGEFTYQIVSFNGSNSSLLEIVNWETYGNNGSDAIGVVGDENNKITVFKITKTDGSAFSTSSLWMTSAGDSYTITGYNDGNTTGQSVSVSVSFSGIKTLNFTGVDELRFEGTEIIVDLDDFTYTLGAANAAPTATAPSAPSVTEDDTNVALADDIQVADTDGDNQTVSFTITGGTLSTGTIGITFGGNGNGSASFTAAGTLAAINTALDAATFTPTPNLSGSNVATISFTTNDGKVSSTAASVTFNITEVNDNPTILGLPTDITVSEDIASNVDLSAATFNDVDAGSNSIVLTITASTGTLSASSGGSVTIGGSGTGTISLTGAAVDIDTYLNTASNIKYTGVLNVNGNDAANLTLIANDGGYTGSGGGSDVALGTVNIDITAINDNPTISGLPTDITVTEDIVGNVDLSAATFSDADSGSNSIILTIVASTGTFSASSGGSVTIGGSGTGTLSLTGAVANIDTYLNTASNIKYTGALNANGNDAATLTLTANDGGNTGSGGGSDVALGTVNIDITAINDNPTISGLPTDIIVSEDIAGNVDLSAATFSDVDAGANSIVLTIAASTGTLSASSGGSVTIGGSGTGTISLTGAAVDIDTYLNTASNIKYTGALNANGSDVATLTLTANDGGNTGSGGGSDVALGTVNVDITAINDNPTISGLPSDITVTEDIAGNVDLSAATFSDADSGSNSIVLTIAASTGTLSSSSGGSVTIGGSGTGTLSLTGAVANIDTYLNTASNIMYTGALNVNGNDAATLTLTANDGGNTGSGGGSDVALGTVNIDITAINDAPIISIEGSVLSYNENNTAIQIDASATVSDPDGDVEWNGGQLSIQLTVYNEAADEISINDTDGDGIAITISGTNIFANGTDIGDLVPSGGVATGGTQLAIGFDSDATNAIVQEVFRSIRYRNTSDNPGTSVRWITISALDANLSSNTVQREIGFTAVNDDPTISGLPTDITVTEDIAGNVDLSAATFSDADSGSNSIVLTIAASMGTLSASSGGLVTIGGSGSGTLSLTGAVANIDTYLNTASNIKYTGALNANGNDAATLTLTANDGGNTGSGGGSDVALGTVNIDITAINDNPTISGLPTDIIVSEDIAGNVDLSAATFSDVDAGANSIVLTIAASTGTLSASSGGSVTIGGSGTGTISLTGAAVDIDTYLNTASNIKYTGALNANGSDVATLTLTANDGGNTGSGGGSDVALGTVNVDITAINDNPTISGLPSDITVTEDIAGNVDLSAATFSDADSGSNSIVLTIAASTGTLSSSSGGSVTIGGSGTGTLSLTGAVANIDTYLNTASNIMYTGALNVNGNDAATLTLTANDGGNTGSGGGSDVALGTVNIDITAINDAPTASDFIKTIYEGTPYVFATGNFGYTDVDGDAMVKIVVNSIPDNGILYLDADNGDDYDAGEELANGANVSKTDLDNGNLQYYNIDGTSTSFEFVVYDGTGYSATNYTATLTVLSEPTVTLSLDPSSSISESLGSTNVKATLSHSFNKDVTVNFLVSGTATGSGTDYTLQASSIVISEGNTYNSIQLSSVSDNIDENDETVIIDISTVTNGSESGTQQVTATILDDDVAPTIEFIATSSSGAESVSSKDLQVDLSAVSGLNVSVDYAVTGTATGSGTDYTLANGTLTISAGSASDNITIASIINDLLDENNETVIVTLSNPVNATLGTNTVHTYTINDDDVSPTVAFTSASQSSSNESGSHTITAQISEISGRDISVPFTINSSSTATGGGVDYSITASPITILSGSLFTDVVITVALDDIFEGDETVIVNMGSPINASVSGVSTHTATITDDDTVGFTIVESDGSTSVAESGTTDSFTVVLSSQPVSNVVLNIAIDKTDEIAIDKSVLTFTSSNWNSPQTVVVSGVDDSVLDGNIVANITISVNDEISSDEYDSLLDQIISVTNIDDDNYPSVSTVDATNISTTSAILNGTVNANNQSVSVGFEYGITSSYGSYIAFDQNPVTGTANTDVSKTITNLLPNTIYYFRVVASRSNSTIYGDNKTFTTDKYSQVITFNKLPSKTTKDPDFNPNATSSAGLEVSYTSSNSQIATVVNNLIHIVGAGTCTVTAFQLGNDTVYAATSVIQNLTVTKVISDEESKLFIMHPNPAKNSLHLEIDAVEAPDGITVRIVSLSGKVMYNNKVEDLNFTLDLNFLKIGMYFIQIITPNGVDERKLIIE